MNSLDINTPTFPLQQYRDPAITISWTLQRQPMYIGYQDILITR